MLTYADPDTTISGTVEHQPCSRESNSVSFRRGNSILSGYRALFIWSLKSILRATFGMYAEMLL